MEVDRSGDSDHPRGTVLSGWEFFADNEDFSDGN
jgi:hypothetical protein